MDPGAGGGAILIVILRVAGKPAAFAPGSVVQPDLKALDIPFRVEAGEQDARPPPKVKEHLAIPYEPFAWDDRYNGIDDFLLARKRSLESAA